MDANLEVGGARPRAAVYATQRMRGTMFEVVVQRGQEFKKIVRSTRHSEAHVPCLPRATARIGPLLARSIFLFLCMR